MDMSRNTNQPAGGMNITTIVPIIAFGLFIFFGGVLLSQLTPILFPPQASAESEQVDGLFRLLLLIGGTIFLLVEGLLVFAIIRYRAKPGDTSDGPNTHGNMTLEIIWTVIPAIIVTVLSVLSFNVWNTTRVVRENENMVNGAPITVKVIAQRYAWAFEYHTGQANPNNPETPIVVNSPLLHTYVGQNVKLEMTTKDVIHSFWVPSMRVKQDVIPGRTTELRFTPIAAGEYPIVCTELCGDGHGRMVATVVVHPDEETYLAAFYEPSIDLILNPPADPVLAGEQVLASGAYPCASCHRLDSLGWQGITGPNLNGIGVRAGNRASAAGSADAISYLVNSIYEPNRYVVPGFAAGQMPQFGPEGSGALNVMPPQDLYNIVAYLCTQTDGADSSCAGPYTETIPAAIQTEYGLTVSVEVGDTGDTTEPMAEATAEPMAEATVEATPESSDN